MSAVDLVCLFLAVTPLLGIAVVALHSRLRNRHLDVALLLATLCHESLLICWPSVWAILHGFPFEKEMNVNITAGDVRRVLVGENIFVFALLAGYFLARRRDPYQSTRTGKFEVQTAHPLTRLLIVLGAVNYGLILAFPTLGSEHVGEPGHALALAAFGWCQSLFWLPSLIACAFVVSRPRAWRTAPVEWVVAGMTLLAVVIIGLTAGVRGRLIWVGSLLAFGAYLQRNRLVIRLAFVALLVAVPLFPFMGLEYRQIYQQQKLVGASRSSLLETFVTSAYEIVRNGSLSESAQTLARSLAERGMAVRNSAILYKEYDERGTLDLRTWLGSVVFPVPRALYAAKPMPGSTSESPLDSAIYRVMEEGYGLDGYMGPILASGSAYAEGGLAWVLVSGLALGIAWGLLLSHTNGGFWTALIATSFAGSLLIDGFFTMIQPWYAVLLQAWKCAFLVAALAGLNLVTRRSESSASIRKQSEPLGSGQRNLGP